MHCSIKQVFPRGPARRRVPAALRVSMAAAFVIAGFSFSARGQQSPAENSIPRNISPEENPRVTLPLIICWYKGNQALYIQTEASDKDLATQQHANYVPALANAIYTNPSAVDDIYAVTNFKQGNVIPSAPIPAGPNNKDPQYTPLWRLSKVTWNAGTTAHTLKSEDAILDAKTKGLVTVKETEIVVNCPVIYTEEGGLFPHAVVRVGDHDKDDKHDRDDK